MLTVKESKVKLAILAQAVKKAMKFRPIWADFFKDGLRTGILLLRIPWVASLSISGQGGNLAFTLIWCCFGGTYTVLRAANLSIFSLTKGKT